MSAFRSAKSEISMKLVSAGYSVSLFTDWQSESINEVWIKVPGKMTEILVIHPSFLRCKCRHKKSASHSRYLSRKLHRSNGRAGALVRSVAAL